MTNKTNQKEVVEHLLVFKEVIDNHTRSIDFEQGDLNNRLDKFNAFVKKTVAISDINLEEFNIDDDMVEEYLQMYKEKGTYPRIVFDEVSGSIIDGTHRANALAKAGLTEIDAYVGTEANLDPHWIPQSEDEEFDSENDFDNEDHGDAPNDELNDEPSFSVPLTRGPRM